MSRSFDVEDFANESYEVRMTAPLDAHDEDHFLHQMNVIERWGRRNCKGKFLILINQVLFTDERDALIFKLKFG